MDKCLQTNGQTRLFYGQVLFSHLVHYCRAAHFLFKKSQFYVIFDFSILDKTKKDDDDKEDDDADEDGDDAGEDEKVSTSISH